ncbi:hypothetical protein [Metapseudomonas otitidis]|uniref:hypothetical protein n=1 Tax=Metapseudomonas otitidis TaxID=319939 RepID=UPI00244B665C|nr:hypothetical protein [Pseudomonas otitidis]MDH0339843.1 hypothetical protein [Pseudomonas otitidis]
MRLLTIAAVLSVAFLLVRALLWFTALADRHPEAVTVVAGALALLALICLALRAWLRMPWKDR